MRKKVLLLVGNELCVAGVPNVVMNIVKSLHESYTFDVLAFSTKKGELDEQFLSYGGKIFALDIPRYPQYPIGVFFSYQKLYSKVRQILQENHYHIIHGHSGYFDGVCLLAAQHAGIPIRISHGHGTYIWVGRNFLVKYYLELGKYLIRKNAVTRLACSSIAGNTLFSGASYENVLNPVDITLYADVEKKPYKGIHLLQIGYFCHGKNQVFSLILLEYLRKKGVDARMYLMGYPYETGYQEKMKQIIEAGNMQEFVSFLPRDYDKRKAFAMTDYCILPSQSEGLPLVALESQAAGIPCLMSDNISKDSDVGAGFFLPHNDLEKWAEFIINGVNIDVERLKANLQTISTQAYADKIRRIYEQKI